MINQTLLVLLQYQSYGRSSQSGAERMLMGALSVGLFYLIAAVVRGAKKKVKGKDFEKIE